VVQSFFNVDVGLVSFCVQQVRLGAGCGHHRVESRMIKDCGINIMIFYFPRNIKGEKDTFMIKKCSIN
jgi:hypothetical protein